jgi:hypothetical protein
MKMKRFSEEQIVGVLKEAEAGAKTLGVLLLELFQATRPDAVIPAYLVFQV